MVWLNCCDIDVACQPTPRKCINLPMWNNSVIPNLHHKIASTWLWPRCLRHVWFPWAVAASGHFPTHTTRVFGIGFAPGVWSLHCATTLLQVAGVTPRKCSELVLSLFRFKLTWFPRTAPKLVRLTNLHLQKAAGWLWPCCLQVALLLRKVLSVASLHTKLHLENVFGCGLSGWSLRRGD